MKALLFFLLFPLLVFAGTLKIQEGWQLVGISSTVDSMQLFNSDNVELVWGFDAAAQQWRGYSPDANLSTQITSAGYNLLEGLYPWQAVWVYSSRPWVLEQPERNAIAEPENDLIELYAGWNLVALPQKSVVSTELFNAEAIWKYNGSWELRSEGNVLPFPDAATVAASEGIWVKSKTVQRINMSEKSSELHTFESRDAMLAYIREMVLQNHYGFYGYLEFPMAVDNELSGSGDLPTAGESTTDVSKADDATQTNLQEIGVDESDLIKHNAQYLFYVNQSDSRIDVSSFEAVALKQYEPLASIDLEKSVQVHGLYLQDTRLIVLTSNDSYSTLYDTSAQERLVAPGYAPGTYSVTLYDISNVHAITRLKRIDMEGSYRESRMIEDRLYVIGTFAPYIQTEYPKIYEAGYCQELYEQMRLEVKEDSQSSDGSGMMPDAAISDLYTKYQQAGCYQYSYDDGRLFKYDYDNPTIVTEYLEPHCSIDGVTAALLEPEHFYAPYKLDQRSDMTSIIAIDTASGNVQNSVSFLGNTYQYYASSEALYLISNEYPVYYDFTSYKEQLTIYKFSLDAALSFRGKASVEGRVLNQFSMSEYEEVFRIATTSGGWWSSGDVDNAIYTFKENDGKLEPYGALHGLGKSGETIHAVRFMGSRGYVVTFLQTDPFYTIDLSDPRHPIASDVPLEIEGFSEYFHPVDANRILSIGRDSDGSGRRQGLALQLYDISNFNRPMLLSKVTIGESSTTSEAEYDHKAFAYRNSDALFGFPYQEYVSGGFVTSAEGATVPIPGSYLQYYGIYQVEGDAIVQRHLIGPDERGWSYGSGRGVLFDLEGISYGLYLKDGTPLCEEIQ